MSEHLSPEPGPSPEESAAVALLRSRGWAAPVEPPRPWLRRLISWPGRWVRRQAIRAIGADFFERQQAQLEALVTRIDVLGHRLGQSRTEASGLRAEIASLVGGLAAERARIEQIDHSLRSSASERETMRGAIQSVQQELMDAIEALRLWQTETQGTLERNAADHAQMASLFEQLLPNLEHLTANVRDANERLDLLWRSADRMWGFVHEEKEMIHRFAPFFGQSRGPERIISEHQQRYVAEYAGKRRVVDLGCGRGEFLELLRGAGIGAEGIDFDATLVAVCEGKGLRVAQADLLDWLVAQPDASLDGIFCAQVVEHLPLSTVDRLVAHAARTLAPDGRLVLETLNPTNLNIFMGPYWADPGHRQPIHPWTLTVMCQSRGFMENRVVYSAPPPPETWLPALEAEGAPEWIQGTLGRLNHVLRQLNDSLYGPGQYAVIARRARPEELIPPEQRE